MKLYELKNVKKFYGRLPALDIPYLSFEREEIIPVYGPNGAGKSTLMGLLSFLDDGFQGEILFWPEKGDVAYDGSKDISKDISKETRKDTGGLASKVAEKNISAEKSSFRRKITLVMQDPYLFCGTVLKNVGLGPALRADKTCTGRVEAIVKDLELWDLRDRNVHDLSAGERMKVAIARAIAVDPEVLLLDEPTSSLDKENIGLVEDIIRKLNLGGKTIIFATHDLEQANRLSKEIVYLHGGRVG